MDSLEWFIAPFAFISSESYSASSLLGKARAVRGEPNTDLKIRVCSMAQQGGDWDVPLRYGLFKLSSPI